MIFISDSVIPSDETEKSMKVMAGSQPVAPPNLWFLLWALALGKRL